MAGLLAQGIVAICLSASGQYNTACNKALDAGTKQSGIQQNVDNFENKSLDLAKKNGTETFGSVPVALATAGVFSYKVYKAKSVDFKLPNLGIADTISNQVTDKSYKLLFTWHW